MSLSDFCMWGIPQIRYFSEFVLYMLTCMAEIVFFVWILNISFSILKKIINKLGGIHSGRS